MDATAAAVKEENFEIQSSCVPIYRLPPPVVRTMAEHRPSDKVDDQTSDDGPIFAVIFTGRFRHWLDSPSRDNWTTHPPDSSINQSNNQSIDTLLIWIRRGRSRRGRRGNLSFSCRLLSLRFFFLGPFLFRPSNSIYGHPTHDRNAIKSAGRGVVVGRIRHQPPRPARRLNFSYFVDINGSMRAVY